MSTDTNKRHIKIAGRRFKLPGSVPMRLFVGVILIIGGILGFLPILGFWMIPLGLVILSVDYAPVRRFRRRMETIILRWWREKIN